MKRRMVGRAIPLRADEVRSARPLLLGGGVQRVVHDLVGQLRGDGDRACDAIAGLSAVARRSAAAVGDDERGHGFVSVSTVPFSTYVIRKGHSHHEQRSRIPPRALSAHLADGGDRGSAAAAGDRHLRRHRRRPPPVRSRQSRRCPGSPSRSGGTGRALAWRRPLPCCLALRRSGAPSPRGTVKRPLIFFAAAVIGQFLASWLICSAVSGCWRCSCAPPLPGPRRVAAPPCRGLAPNAARSAAGSDSRRALVGCCSLRGEERGEGPPVSGAGRQWPTGERADGDQQGPFRSRRLRSTFRPPCGATHVRAPAGCALIASFASIATKLRRREGKVDRRDLGAGQPRLSPDHRHERPDHQDYPRG